MQDSVHYNMAVTETPLIEIEGLTVEAGGRSILDLPRWTLALQGRALLLGPSGCGKTTLLHALSGLIRPTKGTVRIAAQDLAALSSAQLDRFRGQSIGIVFQTVRLVRSMTVEQNLALALALAGKPKNPVRLSEALDRVGIAHLAKALPERLSVGEAQRCAIARAIVAQPRLILADEPTSALDDANAQRAVDLLIAEADACGAGLVIATHDQRIKDRFAQRLELSGP
jgi:putative ABC transport system ATP-binding protein